MLFTCALCIAAGLLDISAQPSDAGIRESAQTTHNEAMIMCEHLSCDVSLFFSHLRDRTSYQMSPRVHMAGLAWVAQEGCPSNRRRREGYHVHGYCAECTLCKHGCSCQSGHMSACSSLYGSGFGEWYTCAAHVRVDLRLLLKTNITPCIYTAHVYTYTQVHLPVLAPMQLDDEDITIVRVRRHSLQFYVIHLHNYTSYALNNMVLTLFVSVRHGHSSSEMNHFMGPCDSHLRSCRGKV